MMHIVFHIGLLRGYGKHVKGEKNMDILFLFMEMFCTNIPINGTI